MWLHASPNFIAAGDYVLSPSESGHPPRWGDEATVRRAEALGLYRRDRIYIFDSAGAPVKDHINRFTFVTSESYIYEVKPIGKLESDTDRPGHFSFRRCVRAQVVRCRHWPESRGADLKHQGTSIAE
jgi:hypothetical protein